MEELKTIGIALMFATVIIYLFNYWIAFFSPNQCILLCFNHPFFMESNIELVLSIIVLVFSVYVFGSEVKQYL